MRRTQVEAAAVLGLELMRRPTWALHHALDYADRVLSGLRHSRMVELGTRWKVASAAARVCCQAPAHIAALLAEAEEEDHGAPEGGGGSAVIPRTADGSAEHQALVYTATRCLRPSVVVEVGVGRGATTRAVLSALQRNGRGHLHSVEFPSLRYRYASEVGILVQGRMRARWTLHLGPSRQKLKELFRSLPPPALFVHDGSHNYYTQRHDIGLATRHMPQGAVIIVDDVCNSAFSELAIRCGLTAVEVSQRGKRFPIGLVRLEQSAQDRETKSARHN